MLAGLFPVRIAHSKNSFAAGEVFIFLLLFMQAHEADAGGESIVPRRFGQQPARVGIARLGDAAPAEALAAGMLTGHQAEVTHELAG